MPSRARPRDIVVAPVRFNPCEGWGLGEAAAWLSGAALWLAWGASDLLQLFGWLEAFVAPVCSGLVFACLYRARRRLFRVLKQLVSRLRPSPLS